MGAEDYDVETNNFSYYIKSKTLFMEKPYYLCGSYLYIRVFYIHIQ